MLELGELSVRVGEGRVLRGAEEIPLTKTEFRLLCALALARGAVVTREQLLERVWEYGYFGDTRLLDVHIRRLRRKIEPDPGQPTHVVTVRGVGYRIGTSVSWDWQVNIVSRLPLRARVMAWFSLVSLVVAGALALATWHLSTGYMIGQRERSAIAQATGNARLVEAQLRRSTPAACPS